jgi:hypothetical protein
MLNGCRWDQSSLCPADIWSQVLFCMHRANNQRQSMCHQSHQNSSFAAEFLQYLTKHLVKLLVPCAQLYKKLTPEHRQYLMNRAIHIAIVCMSAMCSNPSVASTTLPAALAVHAGDGNVDGHLLKPYDNVWLVSVRYKDGRHDERGVSSDHVRFRDIAGKTYLTRIEGTTSISGPPDRAPTAAIAMTFNIFAPDTMLPLSGVEHASSGARVEHQFNSRQVTTKQQAPGKTDESQSTSELPELVYDFNGGMTGLILAALPLKIGYRAILPVLGEKGFDTAEIRVVREEVISAGYRGVVKTFVVEIGGNPIESTYWISKTPPYVIKVEVNATNAVASWDIVN